MGNDAIHGSDQSLGSFLERIFDRIPVGLYRMTTDGKMIHANLALARMLGYESVEELLNRETGSGGYGIFHSRSDIKDRIAKDGKIQGLFARRKRADGTFAEFREYADPVRNGKGEVIFYDGAVEDISGFRNAEETILEREQEYETMLRMFRLLSDNMQDMLWAKDLGKRYIFANRAVCKKLLNARDTDEPIGKTHEFFAQRERAKHPGDPEWHTFGDICADSDSIVISTGEPGKFEESGNVKGKNMILDVHKAPLMDEKGKMIGTVGSARIVTREKELESEQKLSQKNLLKAFANLRSIQESSLKVMAKLLETKDPYTAGHQDRVARIAVAIAQELDLEDKMREGLRVAALVHDIGKLNVPIDILSKPGSLARIEMNLIREHPQSGFNILSEIDFPWPVEDIILQHHERMDGSGYPRGLSGDKIMLEARILAVADIVEAMSADRPYRPAPGIEAALHEIRAQRGILFDPDVVAACCELFESGRLGF